VAGLNARVVMTTGGHFDCSLLSPVPDNVRVEDWVDQETVFPDASLAVCHGGSGTTFGALAYGVPLVMVPLFADQFVNAARVDRAGAGRTVERGHGGAGPRRPLVRADGPGITRAITEVLTEDRFRRAARRIAAEMRDAPTIGARLVELGTGATGV
jgi:UDP:flavonoid glycosyltransferase YjiC (YdhE family)